ncbi:MAG: S24/S26 family peptidase [Actinomycetota bacterium]
MVAVRRIAIALLTLSGVAAAITAVLWGASVAGLAHTSVIADDAMRPAFVSGDLVVSTPVATERLRPGDIISLPTDDEDPLVTERVLDVSPLPDGQWSIVARTDAEDPQVASSEHIVGASAWQPTVRVPVVGGLTAAVLEPQVGLPLLALFGLLVGAAMLWLGPRRPVERAA